MAWHVLRALDRQQYDQNYTDQQLVSRLIPYLFRQKPLLIIVVVFSLFETIFSLIIPLLFAMGIDQLYLENRNLKLIYFFTIGYLALLLVEWIVNYIYQVNSAKLQSNIVFDLREDLFRRVNNHDLSFFDKNKRSWRRCCRIIV